MASAWSARTAALRVALEAQGLDIVAPLNLRWYNEVAPETARIAPTADGEPDRVLVRSAFMLCHIIPMVNAALESYKRDVCGAG